MRPVTIHIDNVPASLNEIQNASRENDVVEIAQNFSFTGTPTTTTNLNVSAPTVANVAAVLATLIEIMQRGGLSRTN